MKKLVLFIIINTLLTIFCVFSVANESDKQAQSPQFNKELGKSENQRLYIAQTMRADGEMERRREEDKETRRRAAEEHQMMMEKAKFPESVYDLRARRNRNLPVEKTPPQQANPISFQAESSDYMKQKIPKKVTTKGVVAQVNDDYTIQLDNKKVLKLDKVFFNDEKKEETIKFMRSFLVGKKVLIIHKVERTGSYSYAKERDKKGRLLIHDIKIQKNNLVNELFERQLLSPLTD